MKKILLIVVLVFLLVLTNSGNALADRSGGRHFHHGGHFRDGGRVFLDFGFPYYPYYPVYPVYPVYPDSSVAPDYTPNDCVPGHWELRPQAPGIYDKIWIPDNCQNN